MSVATALVAVAGSQALAAESPIVQPSVCDTGYFYSTTPTEVYVVAAKAGDRIYGDPGVTLTITKGTTKTVTGSLSITTTTEAGIIFAKVSLQVGVTVSYSHAVTTTSGGSWKVPGPGAGWLEMGSHGYNVKYTKYHFASPCTQVNDKTDTIKGATDSAWIKHS